MRERERDRERERQNRMTKILTEVKTNRGTTIDIYKQERDRDNQTRVDNQRNED